MRSYLYFSVFATGLTTLAVEFAASRLLGSVFGTSNLVWASIIGLILIYLTAGYFLGGRWADRRPDYKVFYTILAWGAFTSGLIPFVSRPVLYRAADAFDQLQVGVLLGSFTGVLILFVVPITLLGTISPFAIRLALRDSRKAGKVSGKIYAISTLGSFLGTFTPDLILIPLVGTTLTFVAFSLFLVLVALGGLWKHAGWKEALKWSWMIVVLILLGGIWGRGSIKNTPGQIYETESSYNYIQVIEQDGYRYLRLNEGQGVHSIYHPERLAYNGTWMQVLAAPFFNEAPFSPQDVESMAIVGLAAGTTARQATQAFGPIPVDGFEIDPKIIQVGKEYFGMTQPNLNPIPKDGRWGLDTSEKTYSIISMDAYRPPYIPWHLTTVEFFRIVHEHLTPQGVVAINVGRAPDDERLLAGLVATVKTVFPSVYVIDVPDSFNSIIYATKQPTKVENLSQNYQELKERSDQTEMVQRALEIALTNLRPVPSSGEVFTDDRAPIEWITNHMVLQYVASGQGLE
ncbi:MAG: fused MFS/spermidine synthase [Anaerolineales bacterium]|nr:fused MFS/spermidine synthase [Anaerolineales bacterium]